MRRRVFLVCGLCLASFGPYARAQGAGDLPRVAILSPDSATAGSDRLAAFLGTLRELGYVDGTLCSSIRAKAGEAEPTNEEDPPSHSMTS